MDILTFIRSEQDPRMLSKQETAHMKQVKDRYLMRRYYLWLTSR